MSDVIDEPVTEETTDGPAPEDVLAEARERLAAAERERDLERQARVDAEARAQQVGHQAQTAQHVALDATIASEEARLAQARANYRAAREAGDYDAEANAMAVISAAAPKLEWLKDQKARGAAAPAPAAPQQRPSGGNIPGAAAREWMKAHPKLDTDPIYAAAVQAAHDRAVRDHAPESPGYFASVNNDLERAFGPDHGKEVTVAAKTPKPRVPASSFGTPPGRGNSEGRGAGASVTEVANALGVAPEDVREFARVSFPRLDDAAAIKKYCEHQQAILAERGNHGITLGDGKVYR
jgi:hypothetical protein